MFSSWRLFQNFGEFGAKKYFTDQQTVILQTAITIQLFAAIK